MSSMSSSLTLWLLSAFLMMMGTTELVVANDQEKVTIDRQLKPPHLDPTLTASASTAEVTHMNVFQGLTRIDEQGRVQPALARLWEVSADGLKIIFELQPGVSFHDGRVLDAETVVYSLKRLLAPDSGNPQQPLYHAIENVESVNSHQVALTLSHPDSLLPFRLGLSAAVIVHPASASSNRLHPVGTGPYAFGNWENEHLILQRFDKYWGPIPAIKKAVFTFTANRLELENSLSEGRVDLHSDASPLTTNLQLTLRGDYIMEGGHSEGEVIVAINHAHEALADKRVRQALAHAIDRQRLLTIYPDTSPPLIGSHFSPNHPAYVDLADYYPYDPVQARALLEKAGYGDGLALTLSLPPPIYAERGGLYVVDDLEAVGIDIQIERLEWGEWLSRVFTDKQYDLTLVSHVEPMDIGIYAREDYYFNYDSPEFSQLWQRIKMTQKDERRHALLGEAQRHLAEDAVNVFLYMKPQHSIRRTGLQGVWLDAPIPAVVLEELYWE
ncbi:ABC transporter substrate-binding protein [Vreelandella rituensis]|nr:ABC transporter substrate-binding protein [Halomonas rituensis]